MTDKPHPAFGIELPVTDKPTVTPLTEGTLSALGYLLRFECDCPPNYTERNRHAPDCRYQFVHDYLDDGEIEAILDDARTDSLDVERLARAMKPGHDFGHVGDPSTCADEDDHAARDAATRIAAEYLRAALDKEPKP